MYCFLSFGIDVVQYERLDGFGLLHFGTLYSDLYFAAFQPLDVCTNKSFSPLSFIFFINSTKNAASSSRNGGLASIITGSNVGESYTDNFRRGPGSEDFRQATRGSGTGGLGRGGGGINTNIGGGSVKNFESKRSREGRERDISEYGTSNSIGGQWNDDQRYDNFDSWETVYGRMGRDPRNEFDRDDYEFDRDSFEDPFDREEWDDDEFDDINDRRERWDSIADTRRQEVGDLGAWQKEQGQRGQQDKYGGSYGVGREGNSYYYEPQPGDYTYGRGRKSDERSRRDTEDLLGRGDDDLRRDREEDYEYDSGDFAWQRRRRRRREQEEPPPQQQQENTREVAFNRSRPTSIGNIANAIPRRSNPTIDVTTPFNKSSRRPDSIGKKAWSDSSPSPSNKKQSPTFTYQNEKNDYRRRGEQQSSRDGREIAFGNRNEATTTQFGGNTYSQDRRRSSLETKSSTFGQMRSPPPRSTERINPQQQQQNQQKQRNRVPPPPPPTQQQQYDRGGVNRPVGPPPASNSRWSNQPVQRPVEPQQPRRPQRNTKQLKSTQKPQRYSNQGPLRNEFKKKENNPFDFVDDIIKNGVNILDQIRDVRGDTTTNNSSNKNKNSRMNKRKSKSSSLEEDRTTKVLLADARSYIISDTSLRNILGESISIGEVYTRSYSSTMVNGTNRSRCQISFEVNGSRGGGKGTLIANQEEIIKLDVDIGNDVIEVNVRSQRPQGFNVRDIGR